jgi:hypothetical protein
MLRNPPRIALVLLASLAGVLIAGAVARGEPAATAPSSPSSASADCLAKPDAHAAPGNHWYYRLDRANGRHCWYQRPAGGTAVDTAQSRPSARAIVSPVDRPAPELSADRPSATRDQERDQNTVEPATAAPTQPYSWSTAAPPPTPPAQTVPLASDSAIPSPVIPPQSEAVAEPPRAESVPAAPVRTPVAELPAADVADGAPMPVLFGAAFALAIIVLGSIAARLGVKLLRSRRRDGVARAAASMRPPPFLRAQDAPGLVPPMPREGDITREARPPSLASRAPEAPRNGVMPGDDAAERNRDSASELEQNVRELLRRMRGDLQRTPGASASPQPRSAEELDELLATWRGGRRRPAG